MVLKITLLFGYDVETAKKQKIRVVTKTTVRDCMNNFNATLVFLYLDKHEMSMAVAKVAHWDVVSLKTCHSATTFVGYWITFLTINNDFTSRVENKAIRQ